MKKKVFFRPVSVVLSDEMYEQISELTNQQEISISDYIRAAIQEKISKWKNNNKEGWLNHEE